MKHTKITVSSDPKQHNTATMSFFPSITNAAPIPKEPVLPEPSPKAPQSKDEVIECPVCYDSFPKKTSAMNCRNGHSLCLDCMGKLSSFHSCNCESCDGQR